MIDLKILREKPNEVKKSLEARGVSVDFNKILDLDERRRNFIKETDELKSHHNVLSGDLARNKDYKKLAEAKELKEKIAKLEESLVQVEEELFVLLKQIPNIPLPFVPLGKSEADNKIIREWGKKPEFGFQPKDYLVLTEPHFIDIERAGKVSSSRFGYIKGELARLEFALVQFAIDELVKKGFVPVVPPVLIKKEMMEGMGYVDNEKDVAERYFLEKDGLYLVGTSEQSVGPMHAGEIFKEEDLPRRYVAFSTCFRREAGSYGKDTRGILRVHQFDKVEMFIFSKPEESQKEHEFLLACEEELMQKLGIHYRVVALCTADLAVPSAATFDIESWLPGQGVYRETHSCSNTTDFQARRLNIRYRSKTKNQKLEYVHMLNGTALAIGRMLIAIVENFQTKGGVIKLPEVLHQYLPFEKLALTVNYEAKDLG